MVTVALITAVSALVVAITTGLGQIWQLRIKHLLDRRLAEEATFKAEVQGRQAAIRSCCVAIQAFQDELELLVKAAPKSVLSNAIRNRLFSARDDLRRSYTEHHAVLPYTDRNIVNAARELAINVLLMLDLEGVWQTEFLMLNDTILAELERTSASLSIRHSQLLLSAVKLLEER